MTVDLDAGMGADSRYGDAGAPSMTSIVCESKPPLAPKGRAQKAIKTIVSCLRFGPLRCAAALLPNLVLALQMALQRLDSEVAAQ